MAIKTGLQIQGDVMNLLKGGNLDTFATGKMYRDGMRPRDSKAEDIVVVFTYGNTAQVQTGVVTILVFVPDIAPFSDGTLVMDGSRCCRFEELAAKDFTERLAVPHSDYRFSLYEAITSIHDEDINQSFVSMKVQYEIFQ